MNYAKSAAKEAAAQTFTGLWAASTTPFSSDGSLDDDGLQGDLHRLIDELEVDGIFCTGVMSEFWALSVRERRRQVEAVVAATRGHCPVIAHTGHHSVTETIELTRHAESAGAEFTVAIRPYYPAGPEGAIYDYFAAVCAAVDIGVWIFDTSYAGPPLSLELVDRLADIENICGIKVGHPHAHYLDVLARVGDRILVCEPNETEWLANMRDHGQRVFMSSAAPYLFQSPAARPMLDYTRAALSGDYAKAEELSAAIAPMRALADKWLHGRWQRERVHPVPYIKAWSGLIGMAGGAPRVPLAAPSAAEIAELAADLERVGLR